MPNAPGPKRGHESGATTLSPEDIKLLKSYEEAWPQRLRSGFQKDNPFFAWLMIASRPDIEWPTWCKKYFSEVAQRMLKCVAVGDPYHYSSQGFDFDEHRKMFSMLGIDTAAKKWHQAHTFWAEYELWQEDHVYEANLWRRGLQLSQRDLIMQEVLEEEIREFVAEGAQEHGNRLVAAEVLAEEGIDIAHTGKFRTYGSAATMRRAVRLQRKALEEMAVERQHEGASKKRRRRIKSGS